MFIITLFNMKINANETFGEGFNSGFPVTSPWRSASTVAAVTSEDSRGRQSTPYQ